MHAYPVFTQFEGRLDDTGLSATATGALARWEAVMIAPDRLALGIEPNSSLSVLDVMECAQLAEKRGLRRPGLPRGAGGRFLLC